MLSITVFSFLLAQNAVPVQMPPVLERRDAIKQELRNDLNESREELRQRLETQKQEIEVKRQEVRMKTEEIRLQKADELRKRQEEVKERIVNRLDERRAQAVERITQRINHINDKLTEGYLRRLEAMKNVLDKMVERAKRLEERNVDVSSIRVELSAAYDAINRAREKVLDQKAIVYSVSIAAATSESPWALAENIGQMMSSAIAELRAAHNRLRDEVMAPLRDALKKVLDALRAVVGAGETKE